MTKDELKQKAEDDVIPLEITGSVKVYTQAYVDKQEKRIEELEADLYNKKLAIQNRKADIERLEQENTRLKLQLEALDGQAKNIIKDLLRLPYANDWEVCGNVVSYLDKAEQFIKELEVREDWLCEYCDQYKSCPDDKRCRTCDNGSKWKRSKENDN